MERLTLGILLLLTWFGAFTSQGVHASETISQDIEKFEAMIPEILDFRDKAIDLYAELCKKIEDKKAFSRDETMALYEMSVERKDIRESLMALVERYTSDLSHDDWKKLNIAAKIETLERAMLAASAIFWMDDNYLTEALFYQREGKLRRFINEKNKTFGLDRKEGLRESSKVYYGLRFMLKKSRAMNILSYAKSEQLQPTKAMLELQATLDGSFSYNKRKEMTYTQRLKSNIGKVAERYFRGKRTLRDFLFELKDQLFFDVSYAVGRSILQLQWKKGKLYHDQEALKHLSELMQPGDVLWDKTRHKLSGRVISLTGFWNHNAIYIGTKEQLQKLNIWDHPLLKPFQTNIEEGKVIVESLGMGVVQNSLRHFMNIDDIAVARRRGITDDERADVILKTVQHIGKDYDYNLDVESSETVICSELVYLAYSDVDFNLNRMAGHWSVTPDITAQRTINGGEFELLTLYYGGKRLDSDLEVHMTSILDGRRPVP